MEVEIIKISVVIPAYNEEKDINLCLDALTSQTSKNYEIVVVNDASTDNTAGIVKKYKLRLFNLKQRYPVSFVRNYGVSKAKGDVVVFVDADVIVPENFISTIEKEFDTDCAAFHFLSYDPKTIFQRAWSAYRRAKYDKEWIIHVIKKDVFNNFLFNQEMSFYEDIDFSNRVLKAGHSFKVLNLDVHHIDTEHFSDFFRQRRWQGKSLRAVIKKDTLKIRHFFPIFLFFVALFSPIYLPFLFPLALYFAITLFLFSAKTRNFINSFLWVFLDFFGRFISLWYFVLG